MRVCTTIDAIGVAAAFDSRRHDRAEDANRAGTGCCE